MQNVTSVVPTKYDGIRPIKDAKLKDLLQLLNYILPVSHDFYHGLVGSEGVVDVDDDNEDTATSLAFVWDWLVEVVSVEQDHSCPTHLSHKCPTHLSHKCPAHLSYECPIPISHHVLNFTLYIGVKFSQS